MSQEGTTGRFFKAEEERRAGGFFKAYVIAWVLLPVLLLGALVVFILRGGPQGPSKWPDDPDQKRGEENFLAQVRTGTPLARAFDELASGSGLAVVSRFSEGIAIAGYFNAGQDCTAATRVLAGPRVYEDFVAAITEQARGTRTGAPDDEDGLYGPLNNPSQLSRVEGFLSRTPSHAEVVTGGEIAVGDTIVAEQAALL